MAAKLGNANKAYVKVSSSYEWLGGEQNNSLNLTAEAIEVSDKSNDWAQYIAGKKSATLEITVFADNSDAQQTAVLSALIAGTEVDWAIGEVASGSLSSGFSGKGIITSVSDTNDYGAVASRSISITVTGTVTKA